MKHFLTYFKYDIPFSILCIAIAYIYGGTHSAYTVFMLAFLEFIFSFDNAGINSKYLVRLSPFWRMMFLTAGMAIAVFGMRFLFPFIIVSIAGHMDPLTAARLALQNGDPHTPGSFAYIMEHSTYMLFPFAATFLGLIAWNFFLDRERDETWLSWFERPLIRAGHFDSLSVIAAALVLLGAGRFLAPADEFGTVVISGLIGMVLYLMVNGLAVFMEAKQEEKEEELEEEVESSGMLLQGVAAFSMFLFLEVMDASFSFDGVLGAFSLSQNVIEICLGLGMGAMAVRSLTIYAVDRGMLDEFRFMEHGAHWAIAALSFFLFLELKWELPNWVTGMVGIVFIAASLITSSHANKKDAREASDAHVPGLDPIGIHSSDTTLTPER